MTKREAYIDEHWVARHPGAAITIIFTIFSGANIAGNMWIDNQQAPRWERTDTQLRELGHRDEQLAAYQIESTRHTQLMLSNIAKSAGAEIPKPSRDLEIAEKRVRDIRDREGHR